MNKLTSSYHCELKFKPHDKGTGKTTLVKKLAKQLQITGVTSLSGFYTGELRDDSNSRIGFNVTDITNEAKSAVLARVATQESCHERKSPKVGKYSVDVKSFESIALPSLKVTLGVFIDIIGLINKFSLLLTILDVK